MNSLTIIFISFTACLLGYIFYGNVISRLFEVNYDKKTPAHTKYDGVDYVPAKHWSILFGHHFASIAGAGPILGPVIAAIYWGWVPALIWLIVGSIFMGAVHDYSALIASVRHSGKSIATVAETTLGKKSKIIFAGFLWLTLILVIAVFAAVAGNTLTHKPEVVIPTFGIILVALLIGLLIYKLNVNQILATLIGLGLLFALIYIGYKNPIYVFPFHINGFAIEPSHFWIIVLLIYAFIASIVPVNILLQPRDYLSTFVLFIGLILGYLGLFVSRPAITGPAYIGFKSQEGFLWPMLFVVVACGAISGFHSLVSSGTTAKQLSSMRDAKKIGYGAMILESILAILALLCVTAGLKWVVSGDRLALAYPALVNDPILAFGKGFGDIVSPLITAGLGTLIAITILKTFIMTTLDSATRITRYLTEELFVEGLRLNFFKNKYLQTLVIVIFAGYLAMGKYQDIWPIFGAANQLVAALGLIVITAYLFSKGRPKRYTLIPAIFMLVTTIAALFYMLFSFYSAKKYLLLAVDGLLLVLAFVLVNEAVKYINKRKRVLKNA
jgi:carbon starvation protein